MMIGSVKSPYMSQPSTGGGNAAQLEQQKKALEDEMKRIQGDNKLLPEEKKKKMDMLQKKIQKIESEIQKASKDSEKEAKKLSQNENLKAEDTQEQNRKNQFGEMGDIVDVYV